MRLGKEKRNHPASGTIGLRSMAVGVPTQNP